MAHHSITHTEIVTSLVHEKRISSSSSFFRERRVFWLSGYMSPQCFHKGIFAWVVNDDSIRDKFERELLKLPERPMCFFIPILTETKLIRTMIESIIAHKSIDHLGGSFCILNKYVLVFL